MKRTAPLLLTLVVLITFSGCVSHSAGTVAAHNAALAATSATISVAVDTSKPPRKPWHVAVWESMVVATWQTLGVASSR